MKQKHNGGFSLIETVVAIAILGLIVVPCCSGLLMAIRINEKAQQMMQAQLAVSSAVETLMAEGINPVFAAIGNEEHGLKINAEYDWYSVDAEGNLIDDIDRLPEVTVVTTHRAGQSFYTVTVSDNDELVTVTTTIRAKEVAGS